MMGLEYLDDDLHLQLDSQLLVATGEHHLTLQQNPLQNLGASAQHSLPTGLGRPCDFGKSRVSGCRLVGINDHLGWPALLQRREARRIDRGSSLGDLIDKHKQIGEGFFPVSQTVVQVGVKSDFIIRESVVSATASDGSTINELLS
jgi:hypothetical protein